MLSRRKDPLRYLFDKPLFCDMKVCSVNGNSCSDKTVAASLLDLSIGGCKVESDLNFRAQYNDIQVVVSFELSVPMQLKGTITWQYSKWSSHLYGIRFSDHDSSWITEQLKQYTKQLRQVSK